MVRKSLAKGIALVLAASSLSAAVPVMAMPAENVSIESTVESTDDAAQETTTGTPEAAQPSEETDSDIPDQESETVGPQDEAALQVKVKGDDKPAADGTADKKNPIYTENVTVENGTLTEDFSENNIQFTGVFSGSKITDLQVNEDRTGFTLKFTKVFESTEKNFEGGMTLLAGSVMDANGNVSQENFSVFLYDSYRVEEKEEDKKTITDKDVEDLLRKMMTTGTSTAMNALFKSTIGGDLSKVLVAWMQSQGLNFNDPAEISSSSKELVAIKGMSDQLEQATKDILSGISKAELSSSATNIDNYANPVRNDYETYLSRMESVANWTAENTLAKHQATVDDIMTTVYRYGNGNPNISSSSMANFKCYNNLINLGNAMTGQGMFKRSNIFEINHGIASQRFNYNTQTFESRKAYNEQALAFYDQGYAAVTAAINYDIQKNQSLIDEYNKELDELKALTEKSMSDAAMEKCAAKMNELDNAIVVAKQAIKAGNSRLATLETQRAGLVDAKTTNDAEIDNEASMPYVLCYRNNIKYDRNLVASFTKPDNFAAQGCAESDVHNYIEFYNRSYAAYYTAAITSGWNLKSEWKGRKDNACSNADVFKNSIVYKGNEYSNLDYLNKIAMAKGHTLGEDLGTAFCFQGETAGNALAKQSFLGFYNGGDFSVDTTFDRNAYCYEATTVLWFTKATNLDYDWVNIHHNSHYLDANGKAQTFDVTRSFSLTRQNSFSATNGNVPKEGEMYRGWNKVTNDQQVLVVNFYGA